MQIPTMSESPFDPEFDTLVSELLEKWKVPGLSIAVVHKSQSYSKVTGEVHEAIADV